MCPNCSSDDLVAITLNPRDRPLRFTTCRSCEHRWWTDLDGSTGVPLTDVLAEVSCR